MRAVLRVHGREDARAAGALLVRRGYEVVDDRADAVDLVVVDEWTPEDAPWVRDARANGIPTAVLAELLLDDAAGPVVGVTGTAGKTSTCRALAHLLRACGVPVCISGTARSGNAWPDHSLVGNIPPGAVLVAELTSTHLCHMGTVRVDIGVVTNVRPDHVELHGSLDRYYAAKRRLVDALPPDAPLVLPVDDPLTISALGTTPGRSWGFGADPGTGVGAFLAAPDRVVLRDGERECTAPLTARGTAARAVLAAGAAAMALGVAPDALADAVAQVPPAPHRMSGRALPGGITIIDNTMAATPLKVVAGLHDAPDGPLVLVLGGDRSPTGTPVHASPDEQRALEEALREARRRAGTLVAFGPAADDVRAVVPPDVTARDIREALEAARGACPEGGTILVAPMFPMGPDERDLVAGYGLPD